MNIDQKTPYGGIDISIDALASVAGRAASECYGVVGLAGKSKTIGIGEPHYVKLDDENYKEAVRCRKGKKGYEVDLFLLCALDVTLPEVLAEVQKKVKYDLEKTFGIKFAAVNVYVMDTPENN